MKRAANRSQCPINFTTEIFGDTWSMLIYRDMAALGKKTFGEFMESDEKIGPSVLSERLVHLEKAGIIQKSKDEKDKRKAIYTLTETGIKAVPILYEVAVWGSHTSPHPVAHPTWFESMKFDKDTVIDAWIIALKAGDSYFIGEKSVIKQLGLV